MEPAAARLAAALAVMAAEEGVVLMSLPNLAALAVRAQNGTRLMAPAEAEAQARTRVLVQMEDCTAEAEAAQAKMVQSTAAARKGLLLLLIPLQLLINRLIAGGMMMAWNLPLLGKPWKIQILLMLA